MSNKLREKIHVIMIHNKTEFKRNQMKIRKLINWQSNKIPTKIQMIKL